MAEVTTESLPFPGASRDELTESRKQGAQRKLACAIEAEVGEWIDGRTDETVYVTEEYIAELEAEMLAAAEALEFERAAAIRDRIERMRDNIGEPVDAVKRSDGPQRGPRNRGKKQTGRVPRPKNGP